MKKLFGKLLSITVLSSVLVSSLPIASTVSYAAVAEKQVQKQSDTTESRKKKLKNDYSIFDDDIQDILDQGYTLNDAENALQESKKSKTDIGSSLEKIKPLPVNNSKDAKSLVTSSLGDKSYAAVSMVSAASTNPDPVVPDFSYVNTHPDEAPYSVKLDQETISTLSGSLSLQASDMSLPGRNGLGFTLSRSYDSGSSQFNQMVAYGITNGTLPPNEEKRFPLGKGWTWNISYIEINQGNRFLHLGGSGVYKIDTASNLVGYTWKDLTFATSNATVNGQSAAYVLTSTQKISQYFNSQGQLIQITDAFNNSINFNYYIDGMYGSVLQSITDVIGNAITITYGPGTVVLTKGNQTVTYYKTIQNGKELLSQVVDAVGRKTTYDYDLKDAQFSLVGTTPNTSNPYALLTGVTHPTGSKSVYKYEDSPINRLTGLNSVNQVYRVKDREDQFTKSDNSVETVNHKNITYPLSDIGSSYNPSTPLFFSVAVDNVLTKTTFTNKKVYFDENTPSVFYNTNVETISQYGGKTYTNTTDYTYDEDKKRTSPISTKITKADSSIVTKSVVTTSQSYNDYGNVTSSVDVLGVTTTYTYDATSHLLVGVSKPISATQTQYTEYVRDAVHGNVTIVRVREGNVTGAILQETINENYDTYGNALQTRIKRDAASYVTFQTEYSTAAPYYSAFPTKQTIAVTDAYGVPSTIVKQYDYNTVNGQLKTFIDGNTNSTNYEYDAIGRVTKAIHPDSSFVKVDYFDFQNQVQQTDETGVQTITKWNPLGWKVDAGIYDSGIYKSKAKYKYDQYGRLTSSEDALGNKTSYSYDQWSRQNLVIYSDLSTAGVDYDDINSTKTTTDAENYSIKEIADIGGRITTKKETKNLTAGGSQPTELGSFTFDNVGHVLTATDNQTPKNITEYNYNTLGQLISVKNAKTEVTSYQYDNLGNLLQVTYPDTKTNLKKYNEIGQLIQTTDANGKIEKFFYDANGNQTGLIDRNNTNFKYTYAIRNFLEKKEITDASWVPLAGEEKISFTYDLAGRRKQMTDATGTTGYDYAASTGALNTQTYPDGKTIKYDYDAAGNRFVMNDPFGVNTYYHYDSRNRLDIVAPSPDFLKDTQESKTTDFDARYTYYNNSLLKQITQRNGVTSDFTYDGLRIGTLTEKKSNGAELNKFNYTYDNNGNQKTKTEQVGADPLTASNYNFTYDKLNRIATSDQFNETYGYDNRGNRNSMTTNNPFESPDVTRTFDKRDRLTNVALTSGGNVTYKYNGDGLLWERTENGQTTRYYWDGDQVVAEARIASQIYVDESSPSISYASTGPAALLTNANDHMGGAISSSSANTTGSLTFTSDSISVIGRKGPDEGKVDIVLDGVVVATDVDLYAPTTQYQATFYSNSGLTLGTHTIQLVVKGTKNPLSSSAMVVFDAFIYGNSISNQRVRYIRGQGLIAREDGQGKAYYLQNGHGDVVNLMDSTGTTKLNSYSYDVFGNIVSQQENLPQSFKYSGEMMDDKVGLQYLRARWYDPSMGRFVGEDSVEGQVDNPLSQNRFTYVENNPLTHIDPTGHMCQGVVGGKTYTHGDEGKGSAGCDDPNNYIPDWQFSAVQGLKELGQGFLDYPGEATAITALKSLPEIVSESPAVWAKTKQLISQGWNSSKEWIGVGKKAVVAPRIFTSTDPLVADLANAIEARYPNKVIDVNKVVKEASGRIITDYDIELDNFIIQVKSGGGKGLTTQLINTAASTTKTVIGYGPDIKYSIVKGALKEGYKVITDFDEILEFVGK